MASDDHYWRSIYKSPYKHDEAIYDEREAVKHVEAIIGGGYWELVAVGPGWIEFRQHQPFGDWEWRWVRDL